MSSLSTSFAINIPNIVQDNIDGEVVIVNLQKGYYYSLIGTSADIWDSIISGLNLNKIIEKIIQKYEGEPEQIIQSVQEFIRQLEQEEIIIKQLNAEPQQINKPNHIKPKSVEDKQKKFHLPKIEKYTDMEDLLVLDPIHDVDEMGWLNVQLAEV